MRTLSIVVPNRLTSFTEIAAARLPPQLQVRPRDVVRALHGDVDVGPASAASDPDQLADERRVVLLPACCRDTSARPTPRPSTPAPSARWCRPPPSSAASRPAPAVGRLVGDETLPTRLRNLRRARRVARSTALSNERRSRELRSSAESGSWTGCGICEVGPSRLPTTLPRSLPTKRLDAMGGVAGQDGLRRRLAQLRGDADVAGEELFVLVRIELDDPAGRRTAERRLDRLHQPRRRLHDLPHWSVAGVR